MGRAHNATLIQDYLKSTCRLSLQLISKEERQLSEAAAMIKNIIFV